jgi:uncharacterized protein with PIN domain
MTDEEIINLLSDGNRRILITRDKDLYTRAIDKGFKAILLPYENIIQQLAFIGRELNLNLKVDPNNSRCSICNTSLVKVSNVESVRSCIPPLLRSCKRDFWYCGKCNKVFWKGRMWPNIVKITSAASKNMRKRNL